MNICIADSLTEDTCNRFLYLVLISRKEEFVSKY